MEVIVLAGGKGTRLRSVIGESPKPMALINGVPFLEKQFDWLISQGASKLIVSVGYKYEMITEHFKDEFKGIPIRYVIEEQPLGTGGAICLASKECAEEQYFVVNGDTYYPISLTDMLENYSKNDLMIATKFIEVADRYGLVRTVDDKIIGFDEKKAKSSGDINAGIYLMSKNLIMNMPTGNFSFEEFMQSGLESASISVSRHKPIDDTDFIDIGVPEDYERAQHVIN
ncbi:nucleotidyltransferase family protein [Vibrio sp. La 4.2.2]|uniref:nucleotidyltransferase family protein n=1 Tax=Vibrio sp. La 4.2.2 TaxID=2998830 RepID=UPI0022CDE8E6|nr:nucleotidyltransferase family protein [Vibrio sp. La 4.2.2]MDA0110533.1 nucleotidyltransferase family protein [Vibrio sp. La 4.2.2]